MMSESNNKKRDTSSGPSFEEENNFSNYIESLSGYSIMPGSDETYEQVFFMNKKVGILFKEKEIIHFFRRNNLEYDKLLSKPLYPDYVFFVNHIQKIFILEYKTQNVRGSVDEKLQTCDFKRKQFLKVFRLIDKNIRVEFIYILDKFFDLPKYEDTFQFIRNVNCDYFFKLPPITYFGLPASKESFFEGS